MPLAPALRTPLIAGAATGVAALGIALWAPTDTGPPLCASRFVFQVDCPFCGGLRCVSSWARLDPLAAADHNLVLAIALPLMVLWWVWWLVRSARGEGYPPRLLPPAGWRAIAAVVLVFTVVRNLDLGPVAHWLESGAA